jgi:hypothetical protein
MLSECDDEFIYSVFADFESGFNEVEDKFETNLLPIKDILIDDILNDDFIAEFEANLNEKELAIITNRPECDFKVLTYKNVDYYIPKIFNSFPIPVYDHLKQVGVICQNDINNIQFSVNEKV